MAHYLDMRFRELANSGEQYIRRSKMKDIKKGISVILLGCALLGTPIVAQAGFGMGPGNGTGPVMNIYDGTPVTISGIVTNLGTRGQGMSIDTGTEVVTIYGIGPVRYWEKLNVARPQIGESVEVQGYKVTFSDGSSKIIATTIKIDGSEIQLRAPDTGAPLWRGGFMGRGRNR